MDKFLKASKSSASTSALKPAGASSSSKSPYPLRLDGPTRSKLRYKPYSGDSVRMLDTKRPGPVKNDEEKRRPSNAAITRHLLATLADESNPITHSDSPQRADHVVSCTTGHQVGDYKLSRQPYFAERKKKLKEQEAEKTAGILQGVCIYIDGYLRGTTDIEMKRIVTSAGGEIRHTASGATHILTSQWLSGSKTQKVLRAKPSKVHVVGPEWVMESVKAGRRVSERPYEVTMDRTMRRLDR